MSHTLCFLVQVPYETLNKRFRAAQKNIDRETSHVTMVVAELEKTLSSCPAVDSVVSLLDGVVEKLSVLKRKVSAVWPRPVPLVLRRAVSAGAGTAGPGGLCRLRPRPSFLRPRTAADQFIIFRISSQNSR